MPKFCWFKTVKLLALLLIVQTAVGQSSADQPSRGFGKITPDYQSFYYVRKQLPFFLVDNQGRNVAQILVYVKATPGQVISHEVQETTQYDKNVPLHVIVTNLTRDCAISVEWLDFSFKEDGQPSSRGVGTPPGANPNTSVPAGGSYSHIFHLTSVATFKAGQPVKNEVLPALALQCSAAKEPGTVGRVAQSSEARITSSASKEMAISTLQRSLSESRILDGQTIYDVQVSSDCNVVIKRTNPDGSMNMPPRTFDLKRFQGMREDGPHIYFETSDSDANENHDEFSIEPKAQRNAVWIAFQTAIKACGNLTLKTTSFNQ